MENEIANMTPAMLLPVFYAEHNLGMDGGLGSQYVRIDVSKNFHFYMPNYNARRKAVLWHDIHHLVTGYSAGTFLGECEISAWEIAAGCRKYWAAFIIDTSGVVLGCFIHPKKIIQAYARGRRTMNLYSDKLMKEEVLNMTIADLRNILKLEKYSKEVSPNLKDLLMLSSFLVFAVLFSILSIVQIPFLVGYNIWFAFQKD